MRTQSRPIACCKTNSKRFGITEDMELPNQWSITGILYAIGMAMYDLTRHKTHYSHGIGPDKILAVRYLSKVLTTAQEILPKYSYRLHPFQRQKRHSLSAIYRYPFAFGTISVLLHWVEPGISLGLA
jgi:hypothetical protein